MLSKSDEDFIAKFTATLDSYSIVHTDDGGWLCVGIGPKLREVGRSSSEETVKSVDVALAPAWIDEPRTPGGNGRLSGEWTNEPSGGSVVDVATRKPFDPCADRAAVGFVKRYEAEAAAVAAAYGVPTHYVLGLAARECGYGKKNSFAAYNAFFSLQRQLPEGQKPTAEDIARIPHAINAVPAGEVNQKTGKRAWVYTYDGFISSADSFLKLYGSQVRGSKKPEDFLKNLVKGGYNHGDAKFTDPDVLNKVEERLKCPF